MIPIENTPTQLSEVVHDGPFILPVRCFFYIFSNGFKLFEYLNPSTYSWSYSTHKPCQCCSWEEDIHASTSLNEHKQHVILETFNGVLAIFSECGGNLRAINCRRWPYALDCWQSRESCWHGGVRGYRKNKRKSKIRVDHAARCRVDSRYECFNAPVTSIVVISTNLSDHFNSMVQPCFLYVSE